MDREEIIALVNNVMARIRAGEDEHARIMFNDVYAMIQPLLGSAEACIDIDPVFLFDINEYLNNSEARRAGASSIGLLTSSYEEFRKIIGSKPTENDFLSIAPPPDGLSSN
jgi:hypothetical protein